MELTFELGSVLLLVSAAVAVIALRFGLPYSAGLAAIAIGLALSPLSGRVVLTQEVYAFLIPPLVFTAAFSLDWHRLRRELPLVFSLGIGTSALSAVLVALGMHYLAHWPWLSAFMFAAIIGAADPVSVARLFGRAESQGRLQLLISGESLISDAFAALALGLILMVGLANRVGAVQVSMSLAIAIGGAILCGAAVAAIALFVVRRTKDSLVQIAVTTAAAWISFLIAELLHCSGILATIVTGVIVGTRLLTDRISDHQHAPVNAFWDVATLISSSLVFLLVGIHEVHLRFASIWFAASVGIVMLLAGRACAVYSICPLFRRSPRGVDNQEQRILTRYGLRGALPLALALCIPSQVPGRTEIISVGLLAVAFSLFIEGGHDVAQLATAYRKKHCRRCCAPLLRNG